MRESIWAVAEREAELLDRVPASVRESVTSTHLNYPHRPGSVADCPGCACRCHCSVGYVTCVWRNHY